jgi:hypothetical protein
MMTVTENAANSMSQSIGKSKKMILNEKKIKYFL